MASAGSSSADGTPAKRPLGPGWGVPVEWATTWRSTPSSWSPELAHRLEPVVGMGGGGLEQEPVERRPAVEGRVIGGVGEGVLERRLVAPEIEGQHRQGPADRVHVGSDGRAGGGDLRRLVAGRAVDVAGRVVEAPHRPEVDELHLVGRPGRGCRA